MQGDRTPLDCAKMHGRFAAAKLVKADVPRAAAGRPAVEWALGPLSTVGGVAFVLGTKLFLRCGNLHGAVELLMLMLTRDSKFFLFPFFELAAPSEKPSSDGRSASGRRKMQLEVW